MLRRAAFALCLCVWLFLCLCSVPTYVRSRAETDAALSSGRPARLRVLHFQDAPPRTHQGCMWPKRADHMLVRVARDPLRILREMAARRRAAGQEILYDKSKRPNQLYGHLGVAISVASSASCRYGRRYTARSPARSRIESFHPQTRHRCHYAAFHRRRPQIRRSGHRASVGDRCQDDRRRTRIAFTYDAPDGQPGFYAKCSASTSRCR